MRTHHQILFYVVDSPFLITLCLGVSLVNSRAASGAVQEPTSQPAEQPREDELSKRLIRRAVAGGEDDLMTQIITLMSDAHIRLASKLDPGEDTQAVQSRIIDRLDEAIKTAMQQRRRSSASPSPAEAERRRMPDEKKPDPAQDANGEEQTATDASTAEGLRGDAREAEKLRGPLRESRRGWGHLPTRDREELLQGMDEEVIERYRRQIDQYYRALGDREEKPR